MISKWPTSELFSFGIVCSLCSVHINTVGFGHLFRRVLQYDLFYRMLIWNVIPTCIRLRHMQGLSKLPQWILDDTTIRYCDTCHLLTEGNSSQVVNESSLIYVISASCPPTTSGSKNPTDRITCPLLTLCHRNHVAFDAGAWRLSHVIEFFQFGNHARSEDASINYSNALE